MVAGVRVEGAGMREKGDGGSVLTALGVGIPVLRPDTAHDVG